MISVRTPTGSGLRDFLTGSLAADDDPQCLRLLTSNLTLEGYQVTSTSDGQLALEHIRTQAPDLVILDVKLRNLDGFAVYRRERESSAALIIFVTALGRVQDKVRSLDTGASDYLTKPFSVEELLPRVRALLRRAELMAYLEHTTHEQTGDLRAKTILGDLVIDEAQCLVTVDGREMVLSPIEYHLLAILAQHA